MPRPERIRTAVVALLAGVTCVAGFITPRFAIAGPFDTLPWVVTQVRHEQQDRVREQIERMEARARADERLSGARRGERRDRDMRGAGRDCEQGGQRGGDDRGQGRVGRGDRGGGRDRDR